MMIRWWMLWAVVVVVLWGGARGSILPGVAPDEYAEGNDLEIFAQKLMSERFPVPYDYFALPFCHRDVRRPRKINLGQFFMGERMRPTGYEVRLLQEETCKVHCRSIFNENALNKLRQWIRKHYKVRLSLDNLPVVMRSSNLGSRIGYPLGVIEEGGGAGEENDKFFFNNHVRFTILYHKVPEISDISDFPMYRIVGFEAEALSVAHQFVSDAERPPTCNNLESQMPLEIKNDAKELDVIFTYDTVFKESALEWATRWDSLQRMYPRRREIQWFAIVNSSLLCLFLSTLIMLILLRTLRKDLFNSDLVGSDLDESGWKSLRRDVFRPPRGHVILCILAGTGVQLIVITLVTLMIALLGFVSPEYRGRLIIAALTLWILTSSIAGFVSARLHSHMDGTKMRDVALGTAFLIPGFVFMVVFAINLIFWFTGSIGGTPVIAFAVLLLLWFCISVPLCYIGAQVGSKGRKGDPSSRYSSIPREIPEQSILFGAPMSVAGGGLPFGVLSVELLFIMNSLWQSEIYAMFGFLTFVFLVVMVVAAETSVVVTYVKLINEDHKWWWNAFLSSASSGAYVFLYSIYYLMTHQTLEGLNIFADIVILGYMGIISLLLGVMIGSVGFLASLVFVNMIFSGLRAD